MWLACNLMKIDAFQFGCFKTQHALGLLDRALICAPCVTINILMQSYGNYITDQTNRKQTLRIYPD